MGGVVPTNTEREDRCSKPQRSPELWFLRVPNRTPILTFGIRYDWRMTTGCQGVGGLWVVGPASSGGNGDAPLEWAFRKPVFIVRVP